MATTSQQMSEQQIRSHQNARTQLIYSQLATVRTAAQHHVLTNRTNKSALATIKAQIPYQNMTQAVKKEISDGERAMNLFDTNSPAQFAAADAFEANFRSAWIIMETDSVEKCETFLDGKFKEVYALVKGWYDDIRGALMVGALPLQLYARVLV
jgi:hypothetical protein